MALNKQKGNMYNFISHTWNAIKGKCSHDCSYCYMKRFPQNPIRLDQKELRTDLGKGNFIFVGSSTDMFAKDVPSTWIEKTLAHCRKYPENTYLFQTKDPERFAEFYKEYPLNCIFGTTIETNRENDLQKSPPRSFRLAGMLHNFLMCKKKMVTFEPIMDLDVSITVDWIKKIRPEFVNIGADSGGNKLKEPTEFKIKLLIEQLEKFTKVNLKDNLKRVYSQSSSNTQEVNK